MEKADAEKLIRLARHVSEILSSPADLQNALDATVNLLRTVLDSEGCSIMLLNAEAGVLEMAASSNIARELWAGIKVRIGEGFAGKVAQTGRPLLVRQARDDHAFEDERRHRYTSGSFMCAPLKVKGETIGVINITNRRSREPFTHEQLDIVVSLANLVALAIDNARLLVSAETLNRRLHDILEGVGDGVIAVNKEGEILHLNEIAMRYLGARRGRWIGCPLDEVTPTGVAAILHKMHERTLTERTHIHEDVEWKIRESSDPIPLTLSTTPLRRDEAGGISGTVFVFHDRSLHHKLDELKRIDEAKNNFLAIVSHELRTPLTSIKGAMHLLRNRLSDRLEPDNCELFRIAESNAERLLRQIVNLLDVVNIENRTASLTLRRVGLGDVTRRCVDRVRDGARSKDIEVVEDYAGNPVLLMDEEKVMRAIAHLVENAIKFTPRGGQVTLITDQSGGEARVRVRDSGSGIDPRVRERIFGKFVQAEGAMTRQTGGCGIGLFVARAFAELHGGRIDSINLDGGGCEFALILPAADLLTAYEAQGLDAPEENKTVGSS